MAEGKLPGKYFCPPITKPGKLVPQLVRTGWLSGSGISTLVEILITFTLKYLEVELNKLYLK